MLICFVAFFAVVAGVNAIMIRAAVSTFGGVETGSAYKAGLDFKNEIAAAQQQEARHWRVTGSAVRDASGMARLDIATTDAKGTPVAGLTAAVRLAHPTNARRDQEIVVAETSSGRFRGTAEIPAGHWNLVIDLLRGDARVFRSRSRIVLK